MTDKKEKKEKKEKRDKEVNSLSDQQVSSNDMIQPEKSAPKIDTSK
jgi:hypothetical protein